jgi:sugar O-acyltransferase (sialic acid O-acetyltransferase NeuD family)
MQDVVIVGAGGLGREVSEWIEDINDVTPQFRLVGFVDDDPAKQGQRIHDLPLLGNVEWLRDHPISAVIAIGNPAAKRKVISRLALRESPSIIHPASVLGRYVTIGPGAIVCPGVIVTTDVHIGSFVALNFDLTVGHDATIGDFCTLAPGVHISGYARIGEGCDLGAGAVVVPSVEVGAWSIIGAGTVVTSAVPKNCTAVGAPARVIKTREDGWQLT